MDCDVPGFSTDILARVKAHRAGRGAPLLGAMVVLRTLAAPREMQKVHRADNVPMPTMIEEAHRNGTCSVSTI